MTFSKVIILIVGPLFVLVAFQNCTNSADFQIEPSAIVQDDDNGRIEDEDPDDTNGVLQLPDGLIALNLNNGDSVTYLKSTNFTTPASRESVVIKKENGRILEITEIQINPIDPSSANELPSFYCNNSVLPHCRHLTTLECTGTSCDTSNIPVVCSEQIHVSGDALQKHFTELSGIRTREKTESQANSTNSQICESPRVYFSKADQNPVGVTLGPVECALDDSLYAFEGHEPLINSMTDLLADLGARNGSSCNLFHQYRWTTTNFMYTASSSQLEEGSPYLYELNYKGNQIADLRFRRRSDNAVRCATNIMLNEPEIRSFFPTTGLRYDILKTNQLMTGVPTATINYQDSSYGALGEAKFYLNEDTAKTFNGGAILDSGHEDQMTAAVTAIINRSINTGNATACP